MLELLVEMNKFMTIVLYSICLRFCMHDVDLDHQQEVYVSINIGNERNKYAKGK